MTVNVYTVPDGRITAVPVKVHASKINILPFMGAVAAADRALAALPPVAKLRGPNARNYVNTLQGLAQDVEDATYRLAECDRAIADDLASRPPYKLSPVKANGFPFATGSQPVIKHTMSEATLTLLLAETDGDKRLAIFAASNPRPSASIPNPKRSDLPDILALAGTAENFFAGLSRGEYAVPSSSQVKSGTTSAATAAKSASERTRETVADMFAVFAPAKA